MFGNGGVVGCGGFAFGLLSRGCWGRDSEGSYLDFEMGFCVLVVVVIVVWVGCIG